MPITALPTAPSRSSPSTFPALADAWIAAFTNTTVGEVNTTLTAMNTAAATATTQVSLAAAQVALATDQATASANSATASASSAAAAGATAWASGTTYSIGAARYSLIDFQTYRRTTAGAGTTDPSLDLSNWTPVLRIYNGSSNVATIGTSLTLDSTSSRLQRLSPSVNTLDVVLPAATTLTTGLNLFRINNTSTSNSIGIVNNASSVLGYLTASDEVTYDLADNTTAGGSWTTVNNKVLAIIASLAATSTGTGSLDTGLGTYRACELSSSLGITSYLNASGYPTVVAVDTATGVFGTPLQVEAVSGSGTAMAVLPLTSTTALLVYNNTKVTVISVSGTTCTTGNLLQIPSSFSLLYPSGTGGQPNIIKLSSTLFLTVGGWGASPIVTAITISGTTVSRIQATITGIAEMWGGFYDWVPLTSTTALLTATNATGNSSPYTNYCCVVTVTAGTPSFGALISRSVTNQTAPQPLLAYSATKVLQLIGTGTNIYTRVLTISGTTITASAEQLIRSDTTEAAMNGYLFQVSPTYPDAYNANHFGGSLTSVGAIPFWKLGGTYFACQSRADVIDILNVNFTAGTSTNTTLTTASIVSTTSSAGRCITDNNTLLNFRYSGTALTIGRAVGSSSGLTAQSDVTTTVTGLAAQPTQVVPGKLGGYLHYTTYTLGFDLNGAIKGLSYQASDVFKTTNIPPLLQFSLNNRAYSLLPAQTSATLFRGQ